MRSPTGLRLADLRRWFGDLARLRPTHPTFALVLGLIVLQVAFGQYLLVRLGQELFDPGIDVTAATATRYTDFVRPHVPPTSTVLYVSSPSSPPITQRLLSYNLPQSEVFWLVDDPSRLTSSDLLSTAHRDHAAFIAFYDVIPPPDLPVAGAWQLETGYSLIELES